MSTNEEALPDTAMRWSAWRADSRSQQCVGVLGQPSARRRVDHHTSDDELRAAGVGDEVLANPAYVRRAPIVDGIDRVRRRILRVPTPGRSNAGSPNTGCSCNAHGTPSKTPAATPPCSTAPSASTEPAPPAATSCTTCRLTTARTPSWNGTQTSSSSTSSCRTTGFPGDAGISPVQPAWPEPHGADRLLVVAGAIHLACQSLLSGECDMALAGGVSLSVPHHVGYWNSPGSMMSAVGHCRPFDVRADGTVFGSGVAIVALQAAAGRPRCRRPHSRRDPRIGDQQRRIHENGLCGAESGRSGRRHRGSPCGADVDASTVSYVETHGTGTPLGDPIEVQGLRNAFAVSDTPRPGPCVLGSVKSNIGHLEVAAGVVGLIKTILCLKNKAIPATLHYTSPNPELRLDETPFTVQSKYGPWEWDGIRRAGVSSFGVGGYQRARRRRRGAAGSGAVRVDRPAGAAALSANRGSTGGIADHTGRRAGRTGRPGPVRRRVHPRPAWQARHHHGGRGPRPRARGDGVARARARQRFRRGIRRRKHRIELRACRFHVPRAGRSARGDGPGAVRHRARLRRALRRLRRGIPQRDGHRPARGDIRARHNGFGAH